MKHNSFIRPSIILTVIFVLLLSSCSGSQPASNAKKWFTAVIASDSLVADDLVCEGMKDEFRNDLNLGTGIGALFGGTLGLKVDGSKVAFKTVEQNGSTAIVNIQGEMRISINGGIDSKDINYQTTMIKEDGVWKWCGDDQAITTGINNQNLPDPTTKHNKIAFRSIPDDKENLFTINSDGTGLLLIMTDAGDPTWSPDGKQIAYVNGKFDENNNLTGYSLIIASADGSNPKVHVEDFFWSDMYWSPKGDQILCYGNIDNVIAEEQFFYSVNVETGEISKWNTEIRKRNNRRSGWSPDAKYFLIEISNNSNNIYKINTSTQELIPVTSDKYINNWSPIWSPNGKSIAFISDRDETNEIYIMKSDGTNITRFTNNDLEELMIHWSPDGKSFLVGASEDRNGIFDLFVMSTQTGEYELVAKEASGNASWSPDSKQIAYNCDNNGDDVWGICVVSSSGGEVNVITEVSISWPYWSPVKLP